MWLNRLPASSDSTGAILKTCSGERIQVKAQRNYGSAKLGMMASCWVRVSAMITEPDDHAEQESEARSTGGGSES